jgi:hypothetical protein
MFCWKCSNGRLGGLACIHASGKPFPVCGDSHWVRRYLYLRDHKFIFLLLASLPCALQFLVCLEDAPSTRCLIFSNVASGILAASFALGIRYDPLIDMFFCTVKKDFVHVIHQRSQIDSIQFEVGQQEIWKRTTRVLARTFRAFSWWIWRIKPRGVFQRVYDGSPWHSSSWSLHFCCFSILTPVCGDISAMTSGRVLNARDNTLASAVVQTVLHEVCLFI